MSTSANPPPYLPPSLLRTGVIRFRRPLVVLVHMSLWTVAFVGAFLLRFDFKISAEYWIAISRWLPALLVLRVLTGWYFGMFHGMWRYTGARDLLGLVNASTLSSSLFLVITFLLRSDPVLPRSVLVIDWLVSMALVGGLRLGIRTLREVVLQSSPSRTEVRKKILIVGAGDAGETLVRELRRTHEGKYEPIGFLDDNPEKVGSYIHGIPVLGGTSNMGHLVNQYGVNEIIIAVPSAGREQMRRIVELAEDSGAKFKTIPGMDGLIDGRVSFNQLRNVAIEDLLRREPVKLDNVAIADFLRGRVVLVTGAGGSIGSELCRQICKFGPAKLILVEQAENNLFYVHRALLEEFPGQALEPRIADICDIRRMDLIFSTDRPTVVYHAAAHKHVPMMEANTGEAIKNNVFGTKAVADLAHEYGVQKFVMVSTDKAVNPTSVMGASKRAAEIYIQALSQRSKTQFITVRFGNVLGSAGSVIPIFKEQIAKGGPITVTHPEMTRYFMTIPEASQLILQAGTMGKGGEIFVLDMGEPVKIVDLARDLIRLSGLRPGEDVEIRFTGVRPGEKLFEELSVDDENLDKTHHPKIYTGKFRPYDWSIIQSGLERLRDTSETTDHDSVRAAFKVLIPEYNPPPPTPLPPGLEDDRASGRRGSIPTPKPSEQRSNIVPFARGGSA